jgi:hypothetical protein
MVRTEEEIRNKIKELGIEYSKAVRAKYDNEHHMRVVLIGLMEKRLGMRWCLGEDITL